jgi:hypothetical protein
MQQHFLLTPLLLLAGLPQRWLPARKLLLAHANNNDNNSLRVLLPKCRRNAVPRLGLGLGLGLGGDVPLRRVFANTQVGLKQN